MQKFILSIVFVTGCFSAFSQKDALVNFKKERTGITKKSMLALGAWSAANLVGSGIATNTGNREMRYFHQMNVMWGGINIALAGLGYWGAVKEKIDNPSLADVLKHQNKIEKTYLINAGLDVLYVGGGLWMSKTSDNQKNPEKFAGYGNSIMVQGAFLLVYDAIVYAVHRGHGKKLKGLVDKVQLSGGPGSFAVIYTF